MATLLSLATLGAWLLTRLISDRHDGSQYLSWVPSPVFLLLAALLLITAAALAHFSRGHPDAPRPAASRTRKLAWAAWLLSLAFVAIAEFHLHRYIAPVHTPAATPRLRVMFWNPVDADNFAASVATQNPDVLVVTNAPARADWLAIRGAMGEPTYSARYDRFTIVSRYPILRWAGSTLGIEGAQPRPFIWRGGGYVVKDQGQAAYVELDTTATLNQTTTLWALDLPSDFNLSRWALMRRAASTLAAAREPAFIRTLAGLDQPQPLEHGFPTPDLIVGDFNTPRGSASLSQVAGTMPNAYDQAGRGLAATWPRARPLVAIDNAFVGPQLRASMYKVLDLGEGHHRALVFEVVGREP